MLKQNIAVCGRHGAQSHGKHAREWKHRISAMSGKQQIMSLIQSGRWLEAKTVCTQLCRGNINDAESWFLLAGIHSQIGELDQVVECCRKVIALQPRNMRAHYNLGIALQQLERAEEAEAAYRAALRIVPRDASTLANLGLLLHERGRANEAADCCRQALAINPALAEVRNTLGLVLLDREQIDAAAECFQQALRSNPGMAQAYYNLGLCRSRQQRHAEAVECFESALRGKPDYAEAYNELGTALRELGHLDQALINYRRAIELKTDFAAAYNNIGAILVELGQPEEAADNFWTALRIKPDYAEACSNLGNALVFLGRHDEALSSHELALQINPDYASGHWNRSWALLLTGDFEQGWREYEWRWKCGVSVPRRFSKPSWDGRVLDGKSILLHAEQGIGDTIQFIRYAALVKQRGGRVLVECQSELMRLLKGCAGIDALFDHGGSLPDFDCHAAIPSLPGIFDTRLDSIPARIPYLEPPALAKPELHRLLAGGGGEYRVGIVWSGNTRFKHNRYRSCRLSDFGALAQIAGVRLFSLQKGDPTTELLEGNCDMPVIDLNGALDDFADTAFVLSQLDLVITVDTSVAHLAGALGKPVWLLLSFAPDWRWLLERTDNPWYPTMRLFRQTRLGDWRSVFERVSASLASVVSKAQVSS
jgi:tetratricopeptide (TPR) repeat protein